jgi:hypothetical protein
MLGVPAGSKAGWYGVVHVSPSGCVHVGHGQQKVCYECGWDCYVTSTTREKGGGRLLQVFVRFFGGDFGFPPGPIVRPMGGVPWVVRHPTAVRPPPMSRRRAAFQKLDWQFLLEETLKLHNPYLKQKE